MHKFEKFIKLLFSDRDKICYGGKFATSVHRLPVGPVAEFFCINPLSPDTDYQKQPDGTIIPVATNGRRADLNVTRFQNFLFEMDTTHLSEQLGLLADCKFPWASITYSGGKSYHAILSLEVPLNAKAHTQQGIDEYKRVWRQLAAVLCKRIGQPASLLDSSTQNPSRLSRMPLAIRNIPNEYYAPQQVTQDLVVLGKLCNEQQLAEILAEAPELGRVRQGYRSDVVVQDAEQFRLLIPVELRNRLEYPGYWAQGEAGNYPYLFKYIIWGIEASGAPKNVMVEFLEKKTFPALRRLGYPEEKLYKAVEDAYQYKEGV